MRAGSADRGGSAASTSEARKRNHYTRPGQASFNERGHTLVTLAMENFGRLGKGDIVNPSTSWRRALLEERIDTLASVCKERIFYFPGYLGDHT